MDFIIVTGFSGSGKSRAINALEDIGFYCIDNIPPILIQDFATLCSQSEKLKKIAVVTDTRSGQFFNDLTVVIPQLKRSGINYKILFLEASDEVLVARYKETRRKHPLVDEVGGSLEAAVELEKQRLMPIRACADYIIDTSLLSAQNLKLRISEMFTQNANDRLSVHCISFGFKYAHVAEADLLFDVRCLPNPFYVDELRNKTGLDKEVRDYVMQSDESKILLSKITDLVDFLLPLYQKEGKSQLVIAFGCTGGKHRSVTFAEKMYAHLAEQGVHVTISHRDIGRQIY